MAPRRSGRLAKETAASSSSKDASDSQAVQHQEINASKKRKTTAAQQKKSKAARTSTRPKAKGRSRNAERKAAEDGDEDENDENGGVAEGGVRECSSEDESSWDEAEGIPPHPPRNSQSKDSQRNVTKLDEKDKAVDKCLNELFAIDTWKTIAASMQQQKSMIFHTNKRKYVAAVFSTDFARVCRDLLAYYQEPDTTEGAQAPIEAFANVLDSLRFRKRDEDYESRTLDFHGRGVYRLIQIVKAAIARQSEAILKRENLEDIKELLLILSPVVDLCKRADKRSTEPDIDSTLAEYVRIYSGLFQEMQICFTTLLEKRRRDNAIAAAEEYAAGLRKRKDIRDRREKEERYRELERRRQLMRDEMIASRGPMVHRRPAESQTSSRDFQSVSGRNQWTEEESMRLLVLLSNNEHLTRESSRLMLSHFCNCTD